MKKVLITGSNGFVGKNLCSVLRRREDVTLYEIDLGHPRDQINDALEVVDCVIHLAGVNRPEDPEAFEIGNVAFLKEICAKLQKLCRAPKVVISSSIQAELDNAYGASKRRAEEELKRFSENSGAECVVYRFKNLFGKWSRPDYNSVTATFCHHIANHLPIHISDPAHEIELTYIDDAVTALISELETTSPGFKFALPLPSRRISLGKLAEKIKSFHDMRNSLVFPDFRDPFDRALYGTYLTYLNTQNFGYDLDIESDQRGSLAVFLKSVFSGQIFVSRTKAGKTRGDHFHHTKAEKFLVLHGSAIIRFRPIRPDIEGHESGDSTVFEYRVTGNEFKVVDIPPGYTHSIQNDGQDDLVTLFWASETFDPEKPDTYFEKV